MKNPKGGVKMENKKINVKKFIKENYTPYTGDESFLEGATEATLSLWDKCMQLKTIERERGGVANLETKIPTTVSSYGPGYIDKELETIVGLQTDELGKRALHIKGGVRMAETICNAYGYEIDELTKEIYTNHRKTHNQGVFDAYTEEMRLARKTGILTGLPDAYGRGRIIGDYRRLPLYGLTTLIEERKADLKSVMMPMTEENIRLREEISEQIRALQELGKLGEFYGFDLYRPAENSKEAVQWLYMAYLAAIKDQNGAAMSLGRVDAFLDIYFEKDLKAGILTEKEVQEIVDHFIMKLRLVSFARTPEYNELFSGDPTWVTASIAGMTEEGQPLVTKTTFRFLHTLDNLGPAPEPNLTILWSTKLPLGFKRYAAKMSIKSSAIQYENDDLMRETCGDDYAIACCVSPLVIGEQMQQFGARANLAKALLYTLNEGRDEMKGIRVIPGVKPLNNEEVLDFEEVYQNYHEVLKWLAELYVNTLNVIHYMHDKYAYESLQMAFHDVHVKRIFATGIAGLSVVADSLSAIKYAKVTPIRNEEGITVDFKVEGEFPKYGNNDDRVDSIAKELVERFMEYIQSHEGYRADKQTQSILTITSNVVYGKKTGTTPCGRKAGEPFAPGANPMHGRDSNGALASLCSVAKLPFESAQDGISNTFSLVPKSLGKEFEKQIDSLVGILDGYAIKRGHHLNINVFDRALLEDAMNHPEKYPQLTIRVSGYAVNFIKLTREQQLDVINRTMHNCL